MRTVLLPLAVGLACFSAPASAASRPIVVELFTSEGCSSCPPADALLTDLAGRGDILPLAFHVTYWNSLGWRDPFSTEAATDRQASYAGRLGGGSYTPEMVVDGRRGMVGSDRGAVDAALSEARGAASDAVAVHLGRAGGGIDVAVGTGRGRGRVILIGFDPRHETPVGRGENAGRTLVEANIVRSMRVIGAYEGSPLHLSAARGAGEAAAVIIQAADGGILGAARL